jgi:hypothetical protein
MGRLIPRQFAYWHQPLTMLGPELQKSGSSFARAGGMRKIMAKHIIEMAQHREKDPNKLAAYALSFVAAYYKEKRETKL